MPKQSKIFKGLQIALDELELLALEGEILDMDLVEGLMRKLDKLKKTIKRKVKK